MGARQKSLRSLGSDYINDFFRGAMFLDKEGNQVLKLNACSNGTALCSKLDLSATEDRVVWRGRSEGFDLYGTDGGSFSLFSWPKLGYRNTVHPTLGNVVYFLNADRSTARGLRDDGLLRTKLPVFNAVLDYLPLNTYFDVESACRALTVFKPKWYTYKEGMQKLRDAEWLGFAINEDIAITIAHEGPNTSGFDIYFRNVLAGSISDEGHIVMRNKQLTRASLHKLLSKEA